MTPAGSRIALKADEESPPMDGEAPVRSLHPIARAPKPSTNAGAASRASLLVQNEENLDHE